MSFLKTLTNFIFQSFQKNVEVRQVRNLYVDRRILRDNARRQSIKLHGKERLRLNMIRKNNIMPFELKSVAHDELKALPLSSRPTQLRHRCTVTARSKGPVRIFRVSRIIFRHLADYNLLSGVQKSTW